MHGDFAKEKASTPYLRDICAITFSHWARPHLQRF